MKEGWTIKTISELCDQMNGIWKGAKPPFVTANILRTTNFTKDCQLRLDDLAIIDVEQKKMDARRLKRGDIIVEKSGGGPKQPVGRVVLFNLDESDYSFCNFTSALRIKHQTELLPDYLYKYLTYLYFSGETEKYQSNLVGFRNLDFKGYVSMKVCYPSLSEQQRIVGILDAEFEKIDALKANAEKNLQNAKDLFQAALKKELEPKQGWTQETIYSLSDGMFAGGDAPKDNMSITPTNDYSIPIIANAVENDGLYGYTNEARVTVPAITIAGRGSGTGFVMRRLYPFFPIVRLIVIIPNTNKLCLDFLYYAIKSLNIRPSGAAIPQLTIPMIKDYLISYPPVKYQTTIADKLSLIEDRCISLQKDHLKTIALCDDLKQSLLRKAFSGEL